MYWFNALSSIDDCKLAKLLSYSLDKFNLFSLYFNKVIYHTRLQSPIMLTPLHCIIPIPTIDRMGRIQATNWFVQWWVGFSYCFTTKSTLCLILLFKNTNRLHNRLSNRSYLNKRIELYNPIHYKHINRNTKIIWNVFE